MGANRAMPASGMGNYGFSPQNMGSDIGNVLYGMFGDAGAPYDQATDTLKQYYNQAQGYQNPFFNMGTSAIPQYQQWLQGMQNPSGFINNLMGQYQQSPWAKFQQEQAIRMANNQGSASGLTGSTPMAQFMQENARNISSQDMQNWLANVIGVNTQYGQGIGNMLTGGQNAANAMTNLAGQYGQDFANLAYGQSAADQQQQAGLWGGLFDLAGNIAMMK